MATNSNQFHKYASEIETFAIDWTNYLADADDGSADTIASASWTVDSGITNAASTVSGNKTLIRLSGGTAGSSYTCMCQVTLTNGSDTPIRYIEVYVDADPA